MRLGNYFEVRGDCGRAFSRVLVAVAVDFFSLIYFAKEPGEHQIFKLLQRA